jgi:hypothetical protein
VSTIRYQRNDNEGHSLFPALSVIVLRIRLVMASLRSVRHFDLRPADARNHDPLEQVREATAEDG